MKNYTIVVITYFLLLSLGAQSQQITGVAGAYGNFIFAGRTLPIGSNEKTVYKNGEPISKLTFPQSEDEMIARVKDFYQKNPYYPNTPDSLLINYWQWATGFYFIDSLPTAAKYPDILYGLGVIYFEELPDKDANTYNYQIKNEKSSETVIIKRPYSPTNYKINYLQHQTNQNQIVIDWIFKGSFDVLKVKCFKEFVGQSQMQETDLLTFLIKSNDTVIVRIMDTSAINGLTYKYHIELIDPIGRSNSKADTAKLTVVPQNSLPIIFNAASFSNDQSKSIDLSWKLQNKKNVQTIDIFRSEASDSGYSLLATVGANDSNYSDFAIKPVTGYWYKLVINGVFERGLNTTFISGILKKGATIIPVNQIQTEPINKGISVNWIKNADDTRGFYVYRALGYKGDFEQISPLVLAENNKDLYYFIDSSSLVKNGGIYTYMIKTLSIGYVLSTESPTSSVQVSAQSEEVFINEIQYKQEGKAVLIVWKNLINISTSIVGYSIYKKESNSNWQLLDELSEETNQFYDENIKFETIYRYKVIPILVNNKEGNPAEIEVQLSAPSVYAPEIIAIEQVGKSVVIQIEKNEQDAVEEIWIFRIDEGKDPKKIATLKPSDTQFEDKNTLAKNTYIYYTILKTQNSESRPSSPNKIDIK